MEYRRSQDSGGASLLVIEVGVQEVRVATSDMPGSMVNVGTVQPQLPTNAQLTAAGLSPQTTPAGSGGIGAA